MRFDENMSIVTWEERDSMPCGIIFTWSVREGIIPQQTCLQISVVSQATSILAYLSS